MALSNIALCSRALLKVGANTISSFEEATAEAEICANLYPSIRDGLISSYPWSFATAQKTLPRLANTPTADYNYAYQLPNNFLRVVSAGSGTKGRGIDYKISEKRLHTDTSSVILTYIFRPYEENFPAFFDQLLIAKLASEFCLPLTESTSRTEFLEKLADKEFNTAKLIDSQQSVSQAIEGFSLIEVRK